jgi:hypothetical protein
MGKKLFFLIMLVALCLACPVRAALQNIIWVSDNKNPENTDPGTGGPREQVWVDLLEANGYAVDLSFANAEGRTLDDGKIAALNAADLIIISRNTDSGSYDNGDAVAQWNSVTTPIMMQVMHIARSSRWRWLDTTNTNDTVQTMLAVQPDHPVFEGVTLDAENQVSALLSTASLTTHTDPGNGTLIAQRADNAGVWIVEWAVGQEFYEGSGQIAGGPRMLLASGGTGGNMDGLYNLTPDGEAVFLNAVAYMIPEPATVCLLGLGGLALLRRRRA